jgi:geranylgeranyl diphosphate synthase type II
MTELLDAEPILSRYAPLISRALDSALPEATGPQGKLHEAMRYSVLGGGKRIRSALCLASCEAVGGDPEVAAEAAAAIELVHTYSLIHDDLPCMDDDDLRRGQPSNHRVFGEAVAVLAGDGLLSLAFEVIAGGTPRIPDSARLEMVRILAGCVGPRGMVGGQALDVGSEGMDDVDLPTLQYIHTRKTGALFSGACRIGGVAGGADEHATTMLGKFGEKLGLAFQIADDLLDETGHAEKLGKSAGRDRPRGKVTYPRILGIEESKRRIEELGRVAADIAGEFKAAGKPLGAIARFIVERTS